MFQEREAAYEKEQEDIRIGKEREVARLRTLQERARDEQAERDALRAKRAQEDAEREWRSKEAGEARTKAETESMLKRARAQQMSQKEHFLAVQAQRERADFERVLKYVNVLLLVLFILITPVFTAKPLMMIRHTLRNPFMMRS